MSLWFWFALAVAFVIIEVLTMTLFFVSLALGALAGAVIDALGGNFVLQWVFAAAVAVLSLTVLRPFALKFLFRKDSHHRSWMENLVNSEAMTLTEVDESTGQVRLSNETWSARTEMHALPLPANATVTVLRIEGAVAIVSGLNLSRDS
jgi:membrane protein implicated in regulation of membrane protease activity